jgi:hypothetical protein
MTLTLENGKNYSMSETHVIPFVIDTRPLCVWDTEIEAINLRFIRGIDPNYFQYVAESSFAALEGENAKYAALTLRTTYSHALETFFALLGAALQAPDCVVGWMLEYKNQELNSLVTKIVNGEEFPMRFQIGSSWRGIAKLILHGLKHLENFEDVTNGFGDTWAEFAQDFLDSKNYDEYNSLKHGFRIQQGGFSMWIGKPGERPFPENATSNEITAAREHMAKLEGSEHGSLYFNAERFIPGDKFNYHLEQHALNWNNLYHTHALRVLVASIGNVKSFILAVNKQPLETLNFAVTSDFGFLSEAHRSSSIGVKNFSLSSAIHAAGIERALTKEDILNTYINPNSPDVEK